MRSSITPEELNDRDSAPFELQLVCRACARESKERFDWAIVDSDEASKGWDGVVLSRFVTCAGCGAVDDYALSPATLVGLRKQGSAGGSNGRIHVARPQLWDGTPLTRPSQGFAHLERLCEQRPDSVEAHRRLGNFCNRFGRPEQAVAAWTRATELDGADFEAAHSLAEWYVGHTDDGVKGLNFLTMAVKAYPIHLKRDASYGRFAPSLAQLLLEAAHRFPGDLGLMAAWVGGTFEHDGVTLDVSDARLRLVDDPEPLVRFLRRADLMALGLTTAPEKEMPTRLQRLLGGPAEPRFDPPERSWPLRAPETPGRNRPCACGSGKKYKRCCGS